MTAVDVGENLLGRNYERTLRYLLVAAIVLVAGLGLLDWRLSVTPRGTGLGGPGVDLVWIVAAVGVGLAVIPGYLDDGMLASWMLGAAPFIALALEPVVVPTTAFDEPTLVGFAMAVLMGIVVGTVGFGIGTGIRREGI